MTSFRLSAIGAAVFLFVTGIFGSLATVQASQYDLDLIQSYVGSWRGSGSLSRTGQPDESVRCRMEVTKSTEEKVNVNGRCTVGGGVMDMYGTLAYLSSSSRYEAVINSSGMDELRATGRRSGSNVSFNFVATNDEGSSNVTAAFGLSNNTIKVTFSVRNDDGSRITATVPMGKI
ncbi:MAG: hypothetical protein KDJ19_03825 [Hyphomicrobiaceae bacterium]|nr:hypothetical protein [Hyphomicrobiaceae bacterium]